MSGRRGSRTSNFELDGGGGGYHHHRQRAHSGNFQLPHGGERRTSHQHLPMSPATGLRNNRYDSLVSRGTIGSPSVGSRQRHGSMSTSGSLPPNAYRRAPGAPGQQALQQNYGSAIIRRGSNNYPTHADSDLLPVTPSESDNGRRIGEDRPGGPLHCLYQLLFGDLREEGDDFDTILRKIVVTVGVPLVLFPVAFAVYMATQIAINGVTAGNISSLIVMFVFPCLWIPSYMYVRTTKDTPDALMDAWLIVTITCVGLMTICLPEYPVSLLAFYLAAIVIMCHTRVMWLELALAAVVYLVSAFNHAVMSGGDADLDLWALPDPYRGTVLERVAYHVTCFGIGLIVISALLMQMREHVRQIAAAKEAAEMSRKVAGELQRYDTDAVQATLESYSRNGLADTHLIETFMAIVDNLELFRPHLPNWMLNALNGGGEEELDYAGADTASQSVYSQSVQSMRSMRLERSKNGSVVGHLRPQDLASDGTGSEFSVRFAGNNDANDYLVKGAKDGNRQQDPRRNGSFMKKQADNPSAITAVGPKPHSGKVTYALMEVVTADDLGLKRFESIGSRFVDRVHQAAAETHAAVHTFVGDTVHVSWNTAGRIALPEVKACRFVANLMKDSGDSAVSVQGCVMTGEARSYLAGTKQQALTVSFKWRDALHAAVFHSRKQHAVYLCPETHRAAKNDMVTRGVDAIRVRAPRAGSQTFFGDLGDLGADDASPANNNGLLSPGGKSGGNGRSYSGKSQVLKLFQLFKERDEVELTADEWMYVKDADQDQSAKPDATLARCLRGEYAAALGEVTGALQALKTRQREQEAAARDPTADIEEAAWVDDEDEDDDVNLEDPVARALVHLKQRIESCIKNSIGPDDFPVDMTDYF